MPVIDNLAVYYDCGEASGNLIDETLGGNNLTDVNSVGSGTGVGGGGARHFNGANQCFYIADNATFSVAGTDFEIALWVNLDSTGLQVELSKWGSSQNEYLLGYELVGNYLSWYVCDSSGTEHHLDFTTFGAFSTGTWYLVTVGYDTASNFIFGTVNAGTEYTTSHSTGVRDGPNNFVMGAFDSSAGLPMPGLVTKGGLWKRKLSSSDRTWLYNAGNGRTYADIVAEAGGGGDVLDPFGMTGFFGE